MSKVCKNCNLAWKDTDDINFCTSCGRPLEFVNDQQSYGAEPIPKDSIIESYKKFWKNYVVFEGRSRRADYWQVILVNIIIGVILECLSKIPYVGMGFGILYTIYSIATIIPGIALGVRRLHDIGKSGLYYLFILIPIVGAIILIVWFATDSEPGDNQYGRNPKYITYKSSNGY